MNMKNTVIKYHAVIVIHYFDTILMHTFLTRENC